MYTVHFYPLPYPFSEPRPLFYQLIFPTAFQPGTTYGCTLAIEDAAILGTLFSRLRSAEQVSTLLYAYQDLHKGRAEMLWALERQNAEVALSHPPRIRDGLVRWTALPTDAPELPPGSGPTDTELAEIAEVWGYYAIDAADEWWVEWGMLRERSHLTNRAGTGTAGSGR